MSTQDPLNFAEMTDEQFEAHALTVLERELGASGLARFLLMNRTGSGDFTRDRRKWQKGITVQQIAERIIARKKASA